MVFQAYGLFPHMTVGDNVAFGPKIKKWSRGATRERVAEAIRTVRLDGFEDRRPGQLSGGQQQRVALARALVNRDGQRILAIDDEPGAGSSSASPFRATITVRPEWIKLSTGDVASRASHVGGTVVDVVYLGSVTQLIVLLPTGERLTVHRLNDEVGAEEPRPGQQVMLRWAAEHSYIVGSEAGAAEIAANAETATADVVSS